MNGKMKECFTPHAMMHNLFGIGLGILLVALIPALNNLWLGVGLIAVALVVDSMRKA